MQLGKKVRDLRLRHGMTVGELALMFREELGLEVSLKVVAMKGWRREMEFEDTGLPWILPSPNMPTLDTAFVYPGACLLEGTNISEGRGTTRPTPGRLGIDPPAVGHARQPRRGGRPRRRGAGLPRSSVAAL